MPTLVAFHNDLPARAGETEVVTKNTILFPKWYSDKPEEHIEVSNGAMFKFELWLMDTIENKPHLITPEAAHAAFQVFEDTETTATIGVGMKNLKVALSEIAAA